MLIKFLSNRTPREKASPFPSLKIFTFFVPSIGIPPLGSIHCRQQTRKPTGPASLLGSQLRHLKAALLLSKQQDGFTCISSWSDSDTCTCKRHKVASAHNLGSVWSPMSAVPQETFSDIHQLLGTELPEVC